MTDLVCERSTDAMQDSLYHALKEIEARDPDGSEYRTTPPIEADYAAHKAWAIETFGQEIWDRYAPGGWDPAPDWI